MPKAPASSARTTPFPAIEKTSVTSPPGDAHITASLTFQVPLKGRLDLGKALEALGGLTGARYDTVPFWTQWPINEGDPRVWVHEVCPRFEIESRKWPAELTVTVTDLGNGKSGMVDGLEVKLGVKIMTHGTETPDLDHDRADMTAVMSLGIGLGDVSGFFRGVQKKMTELESDQNVVS